MDLTIPEWLKDAPAIVVMAFIIVVGLAFLGRILFPQIMLLIKAQNDLIVRQEKQAKNEQQRLDEQREWYEKTLLPTMSAVSSSFQEVAKVTAEAWQSKLEAVTFENEQRLKLMMETRDRERDELRGRVATLEKGIADRDAAISRMENEINVLRAEHERALTKIKESERKIAELHEFNEQKDLRIEELKRSLNDTMRERDSFAEELKRVNARLEELSAAQKKNHDALSDIEAHNNKDVAEGQ